MFATSYNRIECLKILLENNANTSVLAHDEANLLYLAAANKHYDIVEFILKNTDLDPFKKNIHGKCAAGF